MFAWTPATRIFVALDAVDLRQSFNGLCAWVQQRLAQDPLSGHLYVFTNRQRNRLKILLFDGYGTIGIMGRQLQPKLQFQGEMQQF